MFTWHSARVSPSGGVELKRLFTLSLCVSSPFILGPLDDGVAGYHNYHHTFPWDYSASELGYKYNFNITTLLIDFFEWTGLAYDLKKPTTKMIESRKAKTGDGTDNRLTRRTKLSDWAMGMLVTMSQLILALTSRFIVLFIKRHIYYDYYYGPNAVDWGWV